MNFSARELQIVALLQQGLSNKEIGQALTLSPHTVRDYISAMLKRLASKNRVELVAAFAQRQIDARRVRRAADRREMSDRRSALRSK